MKKSFPININGQIFYIDEDAYTLLQTYLSQLRATFTGDEGREIVDDIESRIHEHFAEKLVDGMAVITLDDVNTVIETMGRPEELDGEADSAPASAGPASDGSDDAAKGCVPPPPPADDKDDDNSFLSFSFKFTGDKHLYRNMQNKVLGGVVGGLATFLGWNASVMRVLVVLLLLWLTFGLDIFWPWVILYLILWMIIPAATTPRQILEMQGKPVNVDTVGRTVMQTPPPYDGAPAPEHRENVLASIFSVLGKCLMGFVGLVCAMSIVAIIILVISMVVLLFTPSIFPMGSIFHHDISGLFVMPQMISAVMIAWSMVFLIPAIALVWTSCCVIFNAPAASRSTRVTAIVLEVLFIITAVVLTIVGGASFHLPFSPISLSLAASAPVFMN